MRRYSIAPRRCIATGTDSLIAGASTHEPALRLILLELGECDKVLKKSEDESESRTHVLQDSLGRVFFVFYILCDEYVYCMHPSNSPHPSPQKLCLRNRQNERAAPTRVGRRNRPGADPIIIIII